jgi:Fe-S-cluster formation regulator IscX/YfhJ
MNMKGLKDKSTWSTSSDIKKVSVSDEFIDIYRHFNVSNQIDRMNKLSERELYLLLTFCLDKHDDENVTVKQNFIQFEKQIMEIFEIQDDKETTNQVILDLIKETGDNYIETENIVDILGNKTPDIFTLQEIRDIRIDLINQDDKK